MKLLCHILFILLLVTSCKSTKFTMNNPTALGLELSNNDSNNSFPPPDANITEDTTSEEFEGVGEGVFIEGGSIMVGSSMGRGMGSHRQESHNININAPTPKSTGTVFYNIPDTMDIKQTYTVTVRISKAKNIAFMITDFKDTVKTAVVKTSSKMEVRLVDVNNSFTVVADNSGEQVIDSDSTTYTQWTWNVTPNKSGVNALKIVVACFDEQNNKKEIVYQDKILIKGSVEKATLGFFEEYWQYLLSTFIIPILLWLFKKKKDSNKNE